MKKTVWLIIIHSIILFFGCTSDKKSISVKSINPNEGNKVIKIKGEDIGILDINNDKADKVFIPSDIFDSKIDLSKLILSVEFIPLETTEKSIIGNVDKILFDSDFYFIHDKRNNKLLRFSINGKFLNQIGTIGKGPQELLSIWDVAINNEKKFISILDSKSRKICKYTFSGEFIDSQSLFYSMSQHEYIKNSLVFSVSKMQRNSNIPLIDFYGLILADNNSVPYGLAFKNPKTSNSYVTLNPLRKFGNKIYYHHPFSDGIWEIKDSVLNPIIKFEYERNGIASNIWEKNINNKDFRELLETHTSFSGDYIVTDKFCFFQVFEKEKVSHLFFNRNTKTLISGKSFKYDKERPLTFLVSSPIGYKNDNSFISIKESFNLVAMKNYLMKNENIKNSFERNDWERILKVKQTDNPIIVIYKLKDF